MEHYHSLDALTALEQRLRRLEYYIHGNPSHRLFTDQTSTKSKGQTLRVRLSKLEEGLADLTSRSQTARELLQIYSKHPNLFIPTPASTSSLTTREKLSTIIACAPTYQSTAAQLTTLKDLAIPVTSTSQQLIALKPRLDSLERMQQEQEREMGELRARSARVLQRWYEVSVLGGNECWVEWEGRCEGVERGVRRRERASEQAKVEGNKYES